MVAPTSLSALTWATLVGGMTREPLFEQHEGCRHDEEVSLFGRGIRVSVGAKPTESELPKVAGLAALLAAVPPALGTLAQEGGLRDYVPILALLVLVTLGVFAWGVPSALSLDEPGPSVVGLALSVLGLLTVLFSGPG